MNWDLSDIAIVVGLVAWLIKAVIGIIKPSDKQDTVIALLQQQLDIKEKHNAELVKTYQNDLHTVQEKMESLQKEMIVMSNHLTELATIINERIPKR